MSESEPGRWWRLGLLMALPVGRALFRVRFEGAERIPSRGPAVLAFDHVSVLDGPVLALEVMRRARRETRFLVAAEIFDSRIAGWILRRYGQIPVRRGEGDGEALDDAIRTVR